MAQLTNTRIYGNLNVDAITTLNGDLNANGGINVTPLKNSTNTVDNSAKITLNSVIVDDKQNSAQNENKLSSIMLSSENNSYGKKETSGSYQIQANSLFSYTAEIKNNTAEIKDNAGKLLSLDLHKVNSKEQLRFDDSDRVRFYNINIDDTLYNISVDVSAFPKASSSKPNVSYDNGTSTYESNYTAKTENDAAAGIKGTTNTTKNTVNLQLTVPYDGGEIITDKTIYWHTRYVVDVSGTQFTKLLSSTELLRCVYEGRHGVILHAVYSYVSRDMVAYPVLFYIKDGSVHMSCFSYSSGIFEEKNSLTSDETLRLIVSTKELYDELTNIIA